MSRRQPQQAAHSDFFNDFNFAERMDTFDDDDFGFGGFGRGGRGDPFENPFEQMFRHFQIPRLGMGGMNDFIDNNAGHGGSQNNASNHNRRGMSNELGHFGNFQEMFQMGGKNPGTVITKSYCQKVNYKNGKPEQESYQSQSIKQIDKDGRKIQEKQEAYKNSVTGLEKAAHQRMLDDKGQKIVRQRNRNTNEQEEHKIYKGINENDNDAFNKEFNEYRQKSNFQRNYELLGNGFGRRDQNNNYQLGDGRDRYTPNQNAQRNTPQTYQLPSGGNQGHDNSKANYNNNIRY